MRALLKFVPEEWMAHAHREVHDDDQIAGGG